MSFALQEQYVLSQLFDHAALPVTTYLMGGGGMSEGDIFEGLHPRKNEDHLSPTTASLYRSVVSL